MLVNNFGSEYLGILAPEGVILHYKCDITLKHVDTLIRFSGRSYGVSCVMYNAGGARPETV